MLVEYALGGVEGSISWDGNVRCNAGSLPGWPCRIVGVNSGDAEEDIGLADLEGLGWVGRPSCSFANDHGAAQLLHDVNKLFCSTSSSSTGQDDYAFLGAIPYT